MKSFWNGSSRRVVQKDSVIWFRVVLGEEDNRKPSSFLLNFLYSKYFRSTVSDIWDILPQCRSDVMLVARDQRQTSTRICQRNVAQQTKEDGNCPCVTSPSLDGQMLTNLAFPFCGHIIVDLHLFLRLNHFIQTIKQSFPRGLITQLKCTVICT